VSPNEDYWIRALKSLQVAEFAVDLDPDAAASRAYYAAFYGVSALFLAEDRYFKKHKGVEAAVHRDLVNTGRWSMELGERYSKLLELRLVGDYGGSRHVARDRALMAVDHARSILRAIAKMKPDLFPWQEELFS
jgi:uncharacterized protein (UPF0332 family)